MRKMTAGTLDGALNLIQSGDVIATALYGCEPRTFLRHLHTIAPRLKDVSLWSITIQERYPVLFDPSLQGHIDIITYFYNEACRKGHSSGRFTFVPMNLHTTAKTVMQTRMPTVFVTAVSPPDDDGYVYASMDLEGTQELVAAAKTVIFEINPNIPKVYGECAIPLATADYYYEADSDLPEAPNPVAGPVEKAIAENVASLICDGDCIQLGIGGMPNAVGEQLLEKRDLGIHTEMLTRSMGRLIQAGVITNARKNIDTGVSVAAFAWGDQSLYDLMRDNPSIHLRRVSYVNNPFVIAQNDNVVSVNTALMVDLTGQISSESIGARQFTGTGGAHDFASGAFHSKGGRGIVALSSTAKDGTVSRISAFLEPGSVVSIPRNLADYVVTEYGIAPLRYRSIRQRVENLIAVAHPDFRAELRKEANRLMLW